MTPQDPLPDSIGGRYRVVSVIGSGGMGVVYKAIDSTLGRPVAIKAIHAHQIGDRRGRLRDEALAAASIDHPYLCKVYEFVEAGDESFLVMEYVEGETLASLLARGPLPLARTLAIGAEVAEGLATAHARGMVHRDVKPSNVMVTPAGHVKLLDFGLAKADMASLPDADTHTSPGGRDFAGTPRYMAPEQATGQAVTARADLFALGVLLYECVAGRPPFEGESGYDYARHVIARAATPLAVAAPDVPEALARIIHRCLEKTPGDRPASADEVGRELTRIADASARASLPTAGAGRARRQRRLAGLGVALLVALAWIGWRWLSPPPPDAPASQSRSLVTWPSAESDSSVSPDGRFVAFLSSRDGRPNVYVVPVNGGDETFVRLPTGSPQSLTWSAGGDHLAIALQRTGDGTTHVVVVPIFGGPVQASVSIGSIRQQVRLLRWIDRSIYLQIGGTLQRLDLASEDITPVSEAWSVDGRLTYFDVSLDGRRVAYTLVVADRTDLWIADLDGGRARQLTSDDAFERFPVWHPSGRAIVYQSNRRGQIDLWEWRLDEGAAVPLTSSQGADTPGGLSADGAVLSFTRAIDEADLWHWHVGDGTGRQLTADTRRDYSPSVSADGRIVVFQRSQPTAVRGSLFDSTLFVASVTGDGLRQPREIDDGFAGRLSRDGTWLAYLQSSAEPRRAALLVRRLDTDEVRTVSSTAPPPIFFASPDDWDEQNVVWSLADDTLFYVDQPEAGSDSPQSVRRYRPGDEGTGELLVQAGNRETVRDLFPTADGTALAYLVRSHDDAVTRLRRLELDSGETRDLGRFETTAGTVFGRGWLEGDRIFVLLRQRPRHEDGSRDLDVLLVTDDGDQRVAGTLDHAHVGTVRLDRATGALYAARVEAGVHNLHAFTIGSGDRRPITGNTLQGVLFSAPTLDGSDRILGVQHKLSRDIWIIDARPRSGTSDGSVR